MESQYTATLLADGRVLFVGGLDTTSYFSPSAVRYDLATESFTKAGSISTRRGRHTATLLLDGKVLAAGGMADGGTPSLASAEVFP